MSNIYDELFEELDDGMEDDLERRFRLSPEERVNILANSPQKRLKIHFRERVSKKLAETLSEYGITASTVAHITGVSMGTAHNITHGKSSIDAETLLIILSVFSIPPSKFFHSLCLEMEDFIYNPLKYEELFNK